MKTSNRDWSFPSCSRCYHKWLYDTSPFDEGCEGKPQVCINYYPPLNAEVQASSCKALSQVVEALE